MQSEKKGGKEMEKVLIIFFFNISLELFKWILLAKGMSN